jgi:uncharacterized membrane protein YbhN (UPF0104 family)
MRLALRILISVILLGGICWWVGLDAIRSVLADTEPTAFALCMGWFLVHTALGFANLRLLTHALAPSVHTRGFLRAAVRAWVLGMYSPARMGDLSFFHYLDREGASPGIGLAVVVTDKLLTLCSSVVVGSAALLLLVGAKSAATAALAGLAVLAGVTLLLASSQVRAWVRRRLLGRYEARFTGFSKSLKLLLTEHRAVLATNALLTAARLVVLGLVIQAALRSFGQDVALPMVTGLSTIAQMGNWIPLTLAGAGLTEGTAVALFEAFTDAPAPAVLNAFLAVRLAAYLVGAACFAVIGSASEAAGSVRSNTKNEQKL